MDVLDSTGGRNYFLLKHLHLPSRKTSCYTERLVRENENRDVYSTRAGTRREQDSCASPVQDSYSPPPSPLSPNDAFARYSSGNL